MARSVCYRGEQNRTADGETSRSMRRLQLGGDVPLIVEHDDECVDALPVKHGICAIRSRDANATGGSFFDRRPDDLCILRAEQPTFSSMRIEPADTNVGGEHASRLRARSV